MITVDPRVGSVELVKQFEALKVPCEIETMEFGDFAFDGNGPDGRIRIGIERKVITDFVQSMRSGRLTGRQLPGLLAQFQRVYLVLEGAHRIGRRTGLLEVPRARGYLPLRAGPVPVYGSDISRFLTGLEEAGVRVRYTRSTYETAHLIGRGLFPFWQKPYEEHSSLHTIYPKAGAFSLRKMDEDERVFRTTVCALPGIGWGRSQAVLDYFGSLERAFEASAMEWQEIDGIGAKIAGDVRNAIRRVVGTVSDRRISKSRHVDVGSSSDGRQRQKRQLDTNRRAERRL